LPQLLIVTWRAQPGITDEPQHALMGPITPEILNSMEIPWELFPTESAQVGAALDRAVAHMDQTGRPYALIMQKGSVAAYPLQPGIGAIGSRAGAAPAIAATADTPGRRPSRQDALRAVVAQTPAQSTVLLASTGFCGRELYAIADRPNHLYMVGSMGCVSPLALGLALARPDLRVIALDGDGAALMRLGVFATVGTYGPSNLWHLLLDNGVHDSTGGQATVSPRVSFAAIAAACGYASSLETNDLARITSWLNERALDGTRFARLFIRPGTPSDLPRPSVTPVAVKNRLMQHIGVPSGVH
jgi:phosphonopyruvate decarboxylase